MLFDTCVQFEDAKQLTRHCKMSRRLGYQAAIVEFISPSEVRANESAMREVSIASGIKLIPRVGVSENNVNELMERLRTFKSRKYLVSVTSVDTPCLLLAARDSRVDIISLPSEKYLKTCTEGVVSLVQQNGTVFEISMRDMLFDAYNRTKIMRSIFRFLELLNLDKVMVTLGNRFKSEWEIRGPKQLTTVMSTLFSIPVVKAKRFVRENAEHLREAWRVRDRRLLVDDGVVIQEPGGQV